MNLPVLRETFFGNFITDYKVAAFSRSSSTVIARVLGEIGTDAKIIVEQGAGDGVLTRELLARLPQNGKLIVIEQNSDFVTTLRELLDPRLILVEDSVEQFEYSSYLNNDEHVDIVVSSIPFSFLSSKDRIVVCEKANIHLRPGGKFIIFHQYSVLMKGILRAYFGSVRSVFVVQNIFPCFVIVGIKK